jgi:CheY-like chemotaxis protein
LDASSLDGRILSCGSGGEATSIDGAGTFNSEQRGYIKLLRSSCQLLMTVISDVLDYSKLEAGHMKIESIPFEPLAVVQGSLAAVRGSCEDKGLSLILSYGETCGTTIRRKKGCNNLFASARSSSIIPFRIMGDPNRLRQVLLNLLSNAIKFTKTGGIRVEVSSYVTECDIKQSPCGSRGHSTDGLLRRWVQFVVSDTGMGISEENKNTVFDKYQQANASVARKYGGTGLGLAICSSLVEQMGGTIGVDSELGVGSSFWFALPIMTPPVANDTSDLMGSDSDTEVSHGPLNILVAEDNKINQKLVRNMLKRLGHKSTLVANGEEAISLIEKHNSKCDAVGGGGSRDGTPFDAVLMDIQMPVMDGLEATRRLRTLGYSHLPILGLTASVKRSDYQELGFDDWLPKPILMDTLKAKLNLFSDRAKRRSEQEASEDSSRIHRWGWSRN